MSKVFVRDKGVSHVYFQEKNLLGQGKGRSKDAEACWVALTGGRNPHVVRGGTRVGRDEGLKASSRAPVHVQSSLYLVV